MSPKPKGSSAGQLCWQWIPLAAFLSLSFLPGCASPTNRNVSTSLRFDPPELPTPNPAGPTLRLDLSGNDAPTSPITDFMYFIPLVSPEPVSMTTSPGNTQRTRVTAARRRVSRDSFSVECDFDILGEGSLRNTFDHAPNLQRNAQKLRNGGVLERVLDTITIDGAGAGIIEVEGVITNGLASVNEVRLRFNAHGRSSPVSIGGVDLRLTNGMPRASNEHVARVNTLTFRRDPAAPRMGVSVASVRRKDGGEGLWSKLTAIAANLVLKPIKVDPDGHDAMLNFGRQLAAQASSFTFPRAKNLKDREDAATR